MVALRISTQVNIASESRKKMNKLTVVKLDIGQEKGCCTGHFFVDSEPLVASTRTKSSRPCLHNTLESSQNFSHSSGTQAFQKDSLSSLLKHLTFRGQGSGR
ncbi:hypothetical protein AVEN_72042-1 [Araneus ventricosus]|uniref:Uncharacterized protein n=1 Tax=Araneus ventricosus TaxID=182803 RepID=A0A4Y2KJC9_ARAVE|nr:hypothetical protein AVEN_72042-1 [Araneus ventricosus]